MLICIFIIIGVDFGLGIVELKDVVSFAITGSSRLLRLAGLSTPLSFFYVLYRSASRQA